MDIKTKALIDEIHKATRCSVGGKYTLNFDEKQRIFKIGKREKK